MKPYGVSSSNWLIYNLIFFLEHWMGAKRSEKFLSKIKAKLSRRISKDAAATEVSSQPFQIEAGHKDVPGTDRVEIYRNLAAGWKSTQTWSLDYFATHYGDRIIEISNSKGLTDPNSPHGFEELTLKNYITQIRQGTRKYMKLSGLVQQEPTLQADLDEQWFKTFDKPTSFGKLYYSFIGGKGSVTPLHSEFNCTLYVQVTGQKKWILYDPGDRIFLNAITERRPYFFSPVNPTISDNPALPLQQYANKQEVILNPGDVLWVPPFVWHYVENMTDSIGVAYKFADIPAAWRASRMFTILFFLSTKPSIVYSFFASRLKKEDYVLSKKHSH